jgi:hypothetical protein
LLAEPFDVERIAAQVSAHRGLPLRAPVRLEEGTRFGGEGSPARSSAAREAFWHAFGLVPNNESADAKLPPLLSKGIAGLFDARARTIWIRRDEKHRERARAWALVHEVEHSLQDPALLERADRLEGDEGLALRGLLEGDADVTSAAFVHSRTPSMDHWLAELMALDRERCMDPKTFEGVPPLARRQWLFPYIEGTRFVGAMYRAGGYALVNRVFERPPTSTEQVIHPEKYLAGEQPVPVSDPVAPEGYSRVAAGTMGELRTRGLLEQCERTPEDDAAPLGWGGDAFAVVSDSSSALAVLWSTIWDDEAAAARFEKRIGARQPCAALASGGSAIHPAFEATVLRDGAKVAYVQGLASELRATTVRALLALPGPRPDLAPPVGVVHLRPLADPRSFVAKGRLVGDRYVSEPLGLSVSMRGFEAVASEQSAELAVEEYFGISRVTIHLFALLTSLTPEFEQRLAWDVIGPLEEGGLPLVYEGAGSFATGAGPARSLQWSSGQGTNEALVFVPVCEGRITLFALARGGGFGVMNEVRRWLRSLRMDDGSPACRFVREDVP